MNELQQELFEKQLSTLARGLDYPRTPDIAGAVLKRLHWSPSRSGGGVRGGVRRFAWTFTVILILCSSLMLISPARAAIIEFIQIGIVRIFRAEPTPVAP